MKRREFIILTGVGATSAGVLSACGHPEEKLIPALIPDDEYVPGIDVWKASTCTMCDAGCGIVVRTRDHKANKIEGNPEHPINRGALCARGQAGLQVLYNPDRIKAPMKRVGERFTGQFEELSWDAAIKILADKLREVKANQKGNDGVVLRTNDARGVTGFAASIFASVYKAVDLIDTRFVIKELEARSYERIYNRKTTPVFDMAKATYLLSFGARFLETWHSPVRYSLAFGEFRRGKERTRGKFVQVEPRMSLTGANADEWLPSWVGAEGLIALAIAQVIKREGLIKNAPQPDFLIEPLDEYAPEKISERTGIPPEKIIRLAREFATSPKPLAIGGSWDSVAPDTGIGTPQHTNRFLQLSIDEGDANLIAINFLNKLVGNLNQPGGVILPDNDFDPFEKLQGTQKINWFHPIKDKGRECKVLLLHQDNPVFERGENTFKEIPFIVSFSSFMDETAEIADLLLPDHTALEYWDIRATPLGGKQIAVSTHQPVVKPEFNTRQIADVLFALAREFAEKEAAPLVASAEAAVKKAVEQLPGFANLSKRKSEDDAPEEPSKIVFEKGIWTGETGSPITASPAKFPSFSLLTTGIDEFYRAYRIDEQGYSFALVLYESATLGTGEYANLPLLQELPDAMTSVMWGSWLEMNPTAAAKLGIKEGDLVEIQSNGQGHSLREMIADGAELVNRTVAVHPLIVPVVLYPGIRPDVIAMPYGQGHTSGRYAKGNGVKTNILKELFSINPLSAFRLGIIRANVVKASGKGNLIRFGTNLPEHIDIKR